MASRSSSDPRPLGHKLGPSFSSRARPPAFSLLFPSSIPLSSSLLPSSVPPPTLLPPLDPGSLTIFLSGRNLSPSLSLHQLSSCSFLRFPSSSSPPLPPAPGPRARLPLSRPGAARSPPSLPPRGRALVSRPAFPALGAEAPHGPRNRPSSSLPEGEAERGGHGGGGAQAAAPRSGGRRGCRVRAGQVRVERGQGGREGPQSLRDLARVRGRLLGGHPGQLG